MLPSTLKSLTLSLLLSLASAAPSCPSINSVQSDLGKQLSKGSTITADLRSAPRWSDYGAPQPAFVVNIASAADIPPTIKFANTNNLPFVVQSRGNGWANTFNLGACGFIINIVALNTIEFNNDKTQATIGGGTLTSDMVSAAYAAGTRFANPTCNCLGFLGANLGGGLTRTMGLYGMGVDQIVSASLVLASGETVPVSATQNPDLWWAIRGSVGNFGVVTSAVVKAYPQVKGQDTAWQGSLTFADTQLEDLVQAIHDLDLTPEMEIDFLFAVTPGQGPGITAIPIYFGSVADAEKAFAPILALKPVKAQVGAVSYDHWADFGDAFCTPGGRKPVYGSSLSREGLDARVWRAVFEEFKRFTTSVPDAVGSSVLAEYYAVDKAVQLGQQAGEGGSYPWRELPLHIVVIPLYKDAKLDAQAEAFGRRARDLLRSTTRGTGNGTYINFAHGDETLEQIYGASLPRLQQLKQRYDPQNRFNQYFDISTTPAPARQLGRAP